MTEYEYQVETIYIWDSSIVEVECFDNFDDALEYAKWQNRYYNYMGNDTVQIVISPMFELDDE